MNTNIKTYIIKVWKTSILLTPLINFIFTILFLKIENINSINSSKELILPKETNKITFASKNLIQLSQESFQITFISTISITFYSIIFLIIVLFFAAKQYLILENIKLRLILLILSLGLVSIILLQTEMYLILTYLSVSLISIWYYKIDNKKI
jgi:Ni/Fe-hydrogenase subunit HybB-like protein